MTLNEYRDKCYDIAKSKGWHDRDRGIPEVLCLIHSEVSEALEEYRMDRWPAFCEEIADILIRVFDFAGSAAIDLDQEVERKMAINEQRDYRHGGKRA